MARIRTRAKGEVERACYVGRIRARAKALVPLETAPTVGRFVHRVFASGFIMAGTLGCFVRSGSSTALYIL